MKFFIFIALGFLNIPTSILAKSEEYDDIFLSTLSQFEFSELSKDIVEDATLDVEGIILKYGYPAEVHEVQTEDGYLLTLHRIPRSKNDSLNETKRTPVLLMHGLLSSSADWIIIGPEKALGYLLADLGYDVWLGNARGNFYSRKHRELDPGKAKFWKFSWHEIGTLDLPAMIDYILSINGAKKLHYVGHSQGTTAFFVMGSERPEYNEKILSMQALAPAVHMTNAKSPILKYLAKYAHSTSIILSLAGINEIFPKTEIFNSNTAKICNETSPLLPFCMSFLFLICGPNPDQLNVTLLPLILSHVPAGASFRQLVHYSQLHDRNIFRQYDYGFMINYYKHGRISPPKYKLKNVIAPVVIHYSENDWLVDVEDVYRLGKELPNVVELNKVPDVLFNHLDYIWAIDVKTLLYNTVVRSMKSFE